MAGLPGTAPFEGLLWDSNHPHAARRPVSRPVASLSAKGAPLRGQQSFWRVRQPSRDFPVSRSEPVPTGASHYTRRLCSSAQRAPQRLWVVKNGYVPRPPRIETPRGPPDTTYGAARVAGPGRGITHPFGATHRAPWAPAWARLGFKGYSSIFCEWYCTPIKKPKPRCRFDARRRMAMKIAWVVRLAHVHRGVKAQRRWYADERAPCTCVRRVSTRKSSF